MLRVHVAACLMGSALLAGPTYAQTERNAPPPAGSGAFKPSETDTTTTNKPVPPAGKMTPNEAPAEPSADMGASGKARADAERQSQPKTQAAAPRPNGAPVSYITKNRPGLWRASKLDGVDIYNEANEKVGEISEVLLDRDGKVEAVVIGVGGFLGLGERNVAVPFSALQWRASEPDSDRGAASGTARDGASRSAGDAAERATKPAATARSRVRDAPERAVLAGATKEMLKKAPEFKYAD